MKFQRSSRDGAGSRLLNDESGMILIAVLTLLTALTLAGVTAFIMASTNIKVGGNLKTNQTALQLAMAGAEQGRQTLRAANASSTNPSNFSEELVTYVSLPLASSSALVGGYTYSASLANDSAAGESSTVDANGIVRITSVATGPNNTRAIVTTTVKIYTMSGSSPAVVYSKDNTTLNGKSLVINGNDAGSCGGGDLSAVYVYSTPTDPHTLTPGQATLTGTPPTQVGDINLDLESYINSLKGGATVLTDDNANGSGTNSYGSATNYATVYSDATLQVDGTLTLNNATGYGILLVKGDLKLNGNINWHGMIIVTGSITSSGGGAGGKNIQGQVYSGSSALGDTDINGGVTISYNSCEVKNSLSSQPLKVVNWKQNY